MYTCIHDILCIIRIILHDIFCRICLLTSHGISCIMIIVNKNKAPTGAERGNNMEYNCYSIKTLNKYLEVAKEFRGKGLDPYHLLEELKALGYTSFSDVNMITNLIDSEVETIEEKTYYRIGEPAIDTYGCYYKPSYNFANDRPEIGVSVVTISWLNNLKSVFFASVHFTYPPRPRYIHGICYDCCPKH